MNETWPPSGESAGAKADMSELVSGSLNLPATLARKSLPLRSFFASK